MDSLKQVGRTAARAAVAAVVARVARDVADHLKHEAIEAEMAHASSTGNRAAAVGHVSQGDRLVLLADVLWKIAHRVASMLPTRVETFSTKAADIS
ncbi:MULTISPECIES: hypothetical protein [Sorangium]|uniref:hypothetical protein n=1 Tax=Sorangium TaxID=39643 RepID=UPI003D9C17E1